MNRKLLYTFSLVVFFLMWGVFGFAAARPRGESKFRAGAAALEATPVTLVPTALAGIPVTAKPAPVLTEVFVFYGLIGITALFLILALLSVANRSTAPYIERKSPPADKTPRD